ncbi:MAG: regulatory protein RecX [Gemmatimonadetes bacterium]|nr:regulatory protein RecX [Gemmatimonadota bacterium]
MKRDLAPPPDGTLVPSAGIVAGLRAIDSSGARFEIRVGESAATVSAALIAEYQLAAGKLLTPSEAAGLSQAVSRLRVFDKAVALLALRARSARDLRTALRRRGAVATDANAVVEQLQELGLVNDAAFALAVAQGRAGSSGMSRRRVSQVLARKGIDSRLADEAAREVFDGVDETEAARVIAERRLRSLGRLDQAVRRRRLHAFLARRGFSSDVVRRVLDQVLRGSQRDE